jgi:hypothetical protein
MTYPDVVDVLLHQHARMRRLCADVDRARGDAKRRPFAALDRLITLHELGDRTVVHPAIRDSGAAGDLVGRTCTAEGSGVEQALAALTGLGVRHATFDRRFALLHYAVLVHTAHEERDEFPLLRSQVPARRLLLLAGEVHDLQIIGAG